MKTHDKFEGLDVHKDTIVIAVADEVDESVRDLTRTRSDAVDDLRRPKQRLKSFLLLRGYHYHGTADWSDKHLRYLFLLTAHRADPRIFSKLTGSSAPEDAPPR